MKLSFSHPLHLVLGLTIWSLWFVGVYAGLSLGCMIDPSADAGSWINLTLLAVTSLVVALLLALALRCWRGTSPDTAKLPRFIRHLSAALYLAAALAALAVGLPILVLPPCI